jgi:aminoglycoside phosphotransferase (APT) family kinase protein
MAPMTHAAPQTPLPRHLVALVHSELQTSRPQDAAVIGVGFDVVAWRVPDPTGDWTLRVPRHPRAVEVVEAQTTLMRHLEQHGIPVPREARMLGDGTERCGLYRFVEGRHALAEDAAGARLATQLADILSQLHRVPTEALPARVVRPIEDRFAPIIERCRPHLEGARREWLDAIEKRLERLSAESPEFALVHADLKPEHVILGENGTIRALLDFEGIQVSDPAIDLSRIIQH